MNVHAPIDGTRNRVPLRIADVIMLDERGALDGYGKVELLGGDLLYMNAQWRRHMAVKSELAYRIRVALEAVGSTLFVGIEGSVAFGEHDLPQPDILLTDAPTGDGPVPGGSVALIVEVSDTTLAFDLGRKASLYAAGGIPEYWVVDVTHGAIYVMSRPVAREYGDCREIAVGADLASETLPGLVVRTDRL